MDIKRINETLDYIESHIEEGIDFEKIERISLLSRYNFQKIFRILSGYSLGDYVQRRRMSIAVFQLKETERKIIDIAMDCGYESSDSFARRFKQYYGISPSQFRTDTTSIPTFPKLTISLEIRGGSNMNYRVEELDTVNILGESRHYSTMEEAQREISGFWTAFNQRNDNSLFKLQNDYLKGILGLCIPAKEGGMIYVIGVTSDNESERWSKHQVKKGRYLVFDAIGPVPDEIQRVTREIYSNFLPVSEYELRDDAEFELYLPGDVAANDYKTEIWIPVK